jgi:hypothetical protein
VYAALSYLREEAVEDSLDLKNPRLVARALPQRYVRHGLPGVGDLFKAAYTSSVRPHTPVAEGAMH